MTTPTDTYARPQPGLRCEDTVAGVEPSPVTTLIVPTVAYQDGPPCPVCGRPRVWRGGRCGTGQDCGRTMSIDDPCWTCRDD